MKDLSMDLENQDRVVLYSRNKGRMHEHLKIMYNFLRTVESTYIFANDIEKYADQFKQLNKSTLLYMHVGNGMYEISILKQ